MSRQLVLEHEPQQAARYSQMLQGVLNPSWTSSLAFELDLHEWEGSLRRYEEAAGVQVPDQIKSAVIAQHVPRAIKRFVKMVPAGITADFATLKGAVLAFLTRDRAFTPMGLALRDDDAMLVDAIDDDMQQEVNALGKAKGKGKTSGKNKGGKGSSTVTQEGWWMRPCRFCQGRHVDVMCPQQQWTSCAASSSEFWAAKSAASRSTAAVGQRQGERRKQGRRQGQRTRSLRRILQPVWPLGSPQYHLPGRDGRVRRDLEPEERPRHLHPRQPRPPQDAKTTSSRLRRLHPHVPERGVSGDPHQDG